MYELLYSFRSPKLGPGDGAYPDSGLTNVNGTLYGTTNVGGATGIATVFSITTSGAETLLYSFKGGYKGDGYWPEGNLINVDGTLYGTTVQGGANVSGTVFSISTSGNETLPYSFKGGSLDGEYPQSALINVKGTLYGTTEKGGGSGCVDGEGCGTVFSIALSGTETVLHSFAGGS
ncbi:MAG TPA: choice-of-anchor tandem repeat GloVer-containing protein [Candidatus Cybelea sp.]|nr:choice-of-anchor tandem repeat GloVer-containing protein [Candidatus Cybelea sp.]